MRARPGTLLAYRSVFLPELEGPLLRAALFFIVPQSCSRCSIFILFKRRVEERDLDDAWVPGNKDPNECPVLAHRCIRGAAHFLVDNGAIADMAR